MDHQWFKYDLCVTWRDGRGKGTFLTCFCFIKGIPNNCRDRK